MANTTIQLKYGLVNAAPTSLNVAEPAYSYASNTFFVGSPDGTGVIAVGGKFYLDQQQTIYTRGNSAFDTANAAFTAANNASGAGSAANYANGAFLQANAAFNTANASFTAANGAVAVNTTQNNSITAAFAHANAAYSKANTADTNAGNAQSTADSALTAAGVAQSTADAAFLAANAATATDTTQNNSIAAAFTRANNSINANTGGTITADLNITGNLTVGGNTSYINTEILTVEDSLIKLANNNTTGDVLDIGFYGLYNSSGEKYAGLARPAATDTFFLFKGLTQDPTANAIASGSITAANAATLIANVQAYSVTIGGQDINLYTTNAYTQANTAASIATSAGVYANAAFAAANAATATDTTQNNSITAAFATANSAAIYANGAFAAANAATATDTTQNNSITAAFAAANASFLVANGAAFVANTDYTNLSITSGDYGSASAVAAFKVEANGRISSANSTTIAIAASAITSGTLGVARGGTGAGTFTNNGVLLGQGTSAFATASSSTEGHVLTINSSGVPTFAMISGGTF